METKVLERVRTLARCWTIVMLLLLKPRRQSTILHMQNRIRISHHGRGTTKGQHCAIDSAQVH
jgi:hypothetical protein